MKLAHCLNKTVVVSIPAFFGDDRPRAFTLVDIEPAGLWLASDDLKDRLGPADETARAWRSSVTGFFPFSQILYVVDPSQFAILARSQQRPTATQPAKEAPPDVAREEPRPEERPKHKRSKPRR